MPMTKQELLRRLRALSDPLTRTDIESDHSDADALLAEYIGDKDISEAYHAVEKWYG